MRRLYLLAFVLLLISCSTNETNKSNSITTKPKDSFPKNLHIVNAFGVNHYDTIGFRELKCGLFIDSEGNIFYKTYDRSGRMDTTGSIPESVERYISTIYTNDEKDTTNDGIIELKKVIDTSTFKFINTYYAKDKCHIYGFNPMMDGGNIQINPEIDVSSFKTIPYGNEQYCKDKRHIYHRGNIIENADLKNFRHNFFFLYFL